MLRDGELFDEKGVEREKSEKRVANYVRGGGEGSMDRGHVKYLFPGDSIVLAGRGFGRKIEYQRIVLAEGDILNIRG